MDSFHIKIPLYFVIHESNSKILGSKSVHTFDITNDECFFNNGI